MNGEGAISGAHLNPAVSFGLWVAGKLKPIMLPFYFVAQFIGAMLAFLIVNGLASGSLAFDFSNFGNFNFSTMAIELVGTAVFIFGLIAVVSRLELSGLSKALGIGLSLSIAIVISTTLLSTLQQAETTNFQTRIQGMSAEEQTKAINDTNNIPSSLFVKGATLNPAVALVSTEKVASEVTGQSSEVKETPSSRLGLEVIFGTLIGAGLGALLYRALTMKIEG